jgi:hypothetical protein
VEEPLKAAFMRPRKNGGEEGQNEYARRGLLMEMPFLKTFYYVVDDSELKARTPMRTREDSDASSRSCIRCDKRLLHCRQ